MAEVRRISASLVDPPSTPLEGEVGRQWEGCWAGIAVDEVNRTLAILNNLPSTPQEGKGGSRGRGGG